MSSSAALKESDELLDDIEDQLLSGSRRVDRDTGDRLAALQGYVGTVDLDVQQAHDAVFRVQSRLLRRPPVTKAVVVHPPASNNAWRSRAVGSNGLPDIVIGTPEWWERAEAQLERLLARWDYTVHWARKNPTAMRVRIMRAAWDDYYAGLQTLAEWKAPDVEVEVSNG